MNTLIIEKKEYVVLPKEEYESLLTKAASKAVSAEKLSLKDGKKTCLQTHRQMGKRKVVILDTAVKSIASSAMFIESSGLPKNS